VSEGKIYITETGVELRIGRIPRQSIDRFVAEHPYPDPPMVEVETWAGDTESVPDYEAVEYRRDVLDYYSNTHHAQLDLIADAVQIVDDTSIETELRALGLPQTKASQLLFLTQSPAELRNVVEEVFYQSTVTPRGIMDATQLFGVKWRGKPVDLLAIPGSGATANAVYGDRMAARWGGYIDWGVFCKLPGPRQSEIVALCRMDNRLQTLMVRTRG